MDVLSDEEDFGGLTGLCLHHAGEQERKTEKEAHTARVSAGLAGKHGGVAEQGAAHTARGGE